MESDSNSNIEQNPNQNPNENQNQNPNEILNQFQNKFQNEFGINSVIKVAEFQDKYPAIFLSILSGITLEYLADNPTVMVEFFSRILDKINDIERLKK